MKSKEIGINFSVIVLDESGKIDLLVEPEAIKIKAYSTALDLLKSRIKDCKTIGPMVLSILGLESKKNSGWMYSVNNQVPRLMPEEYLLNDGDKILWYYTHLGMEARAPKWEEVYKLFLRQDKVNI